MAKDSAACEKLATFRRRRRYTSLPLPPGASTLPVAMGFCVLFGLLFCCLACFREGVWTPYTSQDVARWHAQAGQVAGERAAFPATVRAGQPVRAAIVGRATAAAHPEAQAVRVAEMVG